MFEFVVFFFRISPLGIVLMITYNDNLSKITLNVFELFEIFVILNLICLFFSNFNVRNCIFENLPLYFKDTKRKIKAKLVEKIFFSPLYHELKDTKFVYMSLVCCMLFDRSYAMIATMKTHPIQPHPYIFSL